MINDYGRANKYDFNNPKKWYTEYDVPLLDEHLMTNEEGHPVAEVDKSILEVIAANNNKRVLETGDPATLILGHTDDEPGTQEKPAKGFVVNYRVKPFKRDPKTGQIIYAIHGDYKIRHHNTHILEEYPRRSVELWWQKKELDPIALLGGTSPERDLGVVIRKARLRHISMLGSSVPERDLGTTIQFSRHGGNVIESYSIEGQYQYGVRRYADKGKVHKVMHEFKEGELHSGSKHGPKVTSRKQAEAIAMSEAGLSKPKKYGEGEDDDDQYSPEDRERISTPTKEAEARRRHLQEKESREQSELESRRARRSPIKNSHGDSMHEKVKPMVYDDLDMNTDDLHGPEETDPMIAKLFQTREWKELMSTMNMMKSFISEVSQPEGGMGGGPPAGEGEQGFGEEPLPPASGPDGLEHDAPGGDPSLEEEDRLHHGERPVQFGSGPLEEDEEANVRRGVGPKEEDSEAHVKMAATETGLPGPRSTSIPTFGAKGKRPAPVTSYSRNGASMTKTDDRIARLEKANEQLLLKLSRAEAKDLVSQLKDEGIVFGDNPEDAAKGEADDIEYLAHLNSEEKEYHVNEVIRKRYRRKRTNPTTPMIPGVARYARQSVATEQTNNGEEVEFDPQDPQEASDYADCLTLKKMSRSDATKFLMKRRRERDSR